MNGPSVTCCYFSLAAEFALPVGAPVDLDGRLAMLEGLLHCPVMMTWSRSMWRRCPGTTGRCARRAAGTHLSVRVQDWVFGRADLVYDIWEKFPDGHVSGVAPPEGTEVGLPTFAAYCHVSGLGKVGVVFHAWFANDSRDFREQVVAPAFVPREWEDFVALAREAGPRAVDLIFELHQHSSIREALDAAADVLAPAPVD